MLSLSVAVSVLLASASAVAPFDDGGLRGNEAWGNRKAHPARVNPPVREVGASDVLSLRGEWEFDIREKCIPRRNMYWNHRMYKAADWSQGHGRVPSNTVKRIQVPGCWEQNGVGWPRMSRAWAPDDQSPKPIRHYFDGEGWYRKTVEIPESWRGKRVWLKIGGVAPVGWFWVNDEQVAWFDSYCGTYKYEITDLVQTSRLVKVVAQVDNLYPSRQGEMMSVHHWSGLMRDVELEATPKAFIDDAWVRGDFDRKEAEVHVDVADREVVAGDWSVRVTIDGEVREEPAKTGENLLRLPLRDFRPWSPEHPNLHTARVELVENGRVVQARAERFGVRKLEVRGKEFYLNNRPYFLRGYGEDSVYPLTGYSQADVEFHCQHLKIAREAGFNYTRMHTHCELQEYFDAADELGILIEAELPYYGDTPSDRGLFDPAKDAKELWVNYRHHPSFAIYSGGNEGSYGEAFSQRMYRMIKAADPDRLSIKQDNPDMGGENTPENSDFAGGPQQEWPRGSYDPPMPFVCHEYLNLCVKTDSRDEPLYTGEWLAPETRAKRAADLAKVGLDLAWGDRLQDAQHRLQRQFQKSGVETARADPLCDGFCFWTIVDCVVAQKGTYSAQGLFNPFWMPKRGGFTAAEFARFNSPVCLTVDFPTTRRIFTCGERMTVKVRLSNYGEKKIPAERLKWTLGGDCAGEVAVPASPIGPSREIAAVNLTVPAVDKPMKRILQVEFGGATNEWEVWVFPKRKPVSREGVVVAAYGSKEAEEAFAKGGRVVAIGPAKGKPNASLGWWWMKKQVGAAILNHPMLGELPHEGYLSPLVSDIIKDDAFALPIKGVAKEDLVMVGEGGDGFYAYLFVKRNAAGGVMAVSSGLDLNADLPEAQAILDGMVAFVRDCPPARPRPETSYRQLHRVFCKPADQIEAARQNYPRAFDTGLIVTSYSQIASGDPSVKDFGNYTSFFSEFQSRGVELQAAISTTLGHRDAWTVPGDYPKMVGANGTRATAIACPRSKAFKDHFSRVVTRFAKLKPSVVWLDDDFRMPHHKPIDYGCFCEACLDAFGGKLGTNWTLATLKRALLSDAKIGDRRVRAEWRAFNREAMTDLVGVAADAVQAVDPKIALGVMVCNPRGQLYASPDFKAWIARVRQGGGTMWFRHGSGAYDDEAPYGDKGIVFKNIEIARLCAATEGEGIVNLTEEVTCPFLRRTKSMQMTFLEVAMNIGMAGADGTTYDAVKPNLDEQFRPDAIVAHTDKWAPQFDRMYGLIRGKRQIGIAAPELSANGFVDGPVKNISAMCAPGSENWRKLVYLGIPFTFRPQFAQAKLDVDFSGDVLSRKRANEIKDALDRLCGGHLPCRVDSVVRLGLSLWESADGNERVAFLYDFDYDDAADVRLTTDGEFAAELLLPDGSWQALGKGASFAVPTIPAWSVAVVRFKKGN